MDLRLADWGSTLFRGCCWFVVAIPVLNGPVGAEVAPLPPVQAASGAGAGTVGSSLTDKLSRRAIECAAGVPSPARVKGVVFEPGHEMNPEPDTLQPVVRRPQGGYAMAAATTMFTGGLFRGGTDILVAGLDNELVPRWATVFGGPVSDLPVSITATRDGGVAAVSFTSSLWFSTVFRWLGKSEGAVLVSKYAPDGQLEWVQHLAVGGDPSGLSIVATPDGGILVGGGATRDGRFPGFLVHLSDAGQVRWARQVGRDHEGTIAHLAVLPDGTVLASGSHRTARASPRDVWVARFDAQGGAVWARTYHGAAGGSTASVFALADGGAIVIRSPEVERSRPGSRIAVFVIAPDGRVRWSRMLSFEERVTLSNFLEPSPGRLLLYGGSYLREDVAGPLVVELDADGKVVDSRAVEIGSVAARPGMTMLASDQPISVAPDGEGGLLLLGNLIAIPVDLVPLMNARSKLSDLDTPTRARIRLQVFLLRLGAGTPAGPCTRAVPALAADQRIEERVFEFPTSDLPADTVAPVPRIHLGVRSLR